MTKFNSSGSSLAYSTFLGGASSEFADDIAVDNAGKAYVVGTTGSPAASFPDTSNAHDRSHNGANDVFMARLNTAGSALEYCSYMGGSGDEYGRGIAVDSSTKVYITGSTTSGSSSFPETSNAYDKTYGGGEDAFVARFDINVSGSGSLQYNSYLGASGDDSGWGVALDGANKVYVAGQTNSSAFPTKNAADAGYNGGTDAFVAKLDPSVSGVGSLLYSTYVGGSGHDGAEGITAESDGRVTVVGWPWSTNFPTYKPYPMQSSYAGTQDTFVAKLGPQSGTVPVSIIFNTILGAGDDRDVGNSVVVDNNGRIYIAGVTFSNLFPTVDPAQATLKGNGDAYVAKIFPEYIEPGHECRWSHTPGSTTTLFYRWSSDPDLEPGDPWRNAYVQAINSWNAVATKIRFANSASGPITLELYSDPDPNAFAGLTLITCSGSTTTTTSVRGNKAKVVSQGVLAHELGHAQSLGHIASATQAILGTNPPPGGTAVSTPQSLDIELSNTVYP